MSTLIPVLTSYEKEHLSERQPLPEPYLGLSDAEIARCFEYATEDAGTLDLSEMFDMTLTPPARKKSARDRSQNG